MKITLFAVALFLGLFACFLPRALAQDYGPAGLIPEDAPKGAGKMIILSDFGSEDAAYISLPATQPVMGILLIPDAYGLDDFTKAEADRLAAQGYLALAVDIYNGQQSSAPGEKANLVANINATSVLKTLASGMRLFHESPSYRMDRVVAVGWGTGAKFAYEMARENKDLQGAITFYGPVETDPVSIPKGCAPLSAVYSSTDPVATRANVQAFQHLMKAAGNDFTAWFIDAGSGWSNPKSPTYNPTEDKEAWKVVMPFLVRIGATAVKPVKPPSMFDKVKGLLHKA